jgi:succinate dehydrogenase / fumarate reductase cytochrome b subunit
VAAATQQDHSSAPTPVVNTTVRKRAPWPVEFYRSAVGKKWVMAVTGIFLMGFVFAHMVGNLKSYLGPGEANHYAEFLRDLAVPIAPRSFVLWAFFRLPLIAAFALHMHAAYSLTQMNHRARPAAYASERDYVAANFASRTMRWTGIIFLLFLIWHLADLTWGWVDPHFVRGDAYNNMVNSFQRWPVTLLYVVANLALGVHLFHGAWSLFQSLGLNRPRFNKWRLYFARGFAATIVIGNLSFPLLAQAKVLDYSPSERREVCEAAPAATRDGGPCREVAK